MNKFDLFIVTRECQTLTANSAMESLLIELTAKTDVAAVYNNNESWGQFQYWTIETTMDRHEVSAIAHQILNDFSGDDNLPWYCTGHHPRKIRRYNIVRISVYDR